MSDLTTRRPKTLAKMLEAVEARWQSAIDEVFDLSISGEERIQTIMSRLGEDHPAVAAFNKVDAERDALYLECRRRYGPDAVTFDSMWVTFLTVRA